MATLQEIADFVGDDLLQRTDLDAQILRFSIRAYKTICAAVPFSSLRKIASPLTLTENVNTLDISSITDLCGIWSVKLFKDDVFQRRLTKGEGRLFDMRVNTTPAPPYEYVRRGSVLEFNVAPNADDFSVVIRYWAYPTITANPNEGTTVLLYPQEWQELHEWETAYRTMLVMKDYEGAANLMAPKILPSYPSGKKVRSDEIGIIPRLWNNLLTAEYQKDVYDADYSINPLTMRYNV